jgi:hypothetical protein
MGYEEKSEPEIFAGIRSLLPLDTAGAEPASEATIFSVGSVVPLCGFYDNQGWKGNFQQNYDLTKELEAPRRRSRGKHALKLALRGALVSPSGCACCGKSTATSVRPPRASGCPDDPLQGARTA